MKILVLKRAVSKKRAGQSSDPVSVYEQGRILNVVNQAVDPINNIWYAIGEDEWIEDSNSVMKVSDDFKITKSIYTIIKDYKYIYKMDEKTLLCIRDDMPFNDDTDVDEYTLYKYDKVEIPCGHWIKVDDMV